MKPITLLFFLIVVCLTLALTRCGVLDEKSTFLRPSDEMRMLFVPAGEFEMGLDEKYSGAEPAHTVALDCFWIDQTEVTNAQYRLCVEAGVCTPPAKNRSNTRELYYSNRSYEDYPVIYISWRQAADYCAWAGGRLPTEAEWEYAARGQDSLTYPWGDNPPDDSLLNYVNYVEDVHDTTKIGSYPEGASWCDAWDMAGNVWEWTADWYDDYPSNWQKNPQGPSLGKLRVIRGGSWGSTLCFVRSAVRYRNPPDAANFNVGFRCARDAE